MKVLLQSLRLWSIPLAVMAVLPLQPGVGSAEEAKNGKASKPALTTAQRQALFQVERDWELRSFDRLRTLLQQGQVCVKAAQTPDALKSCKKKGKQAMTQLQKERRQVINAKRQDLGLPLLTAKRRAKAS